MSIPKVCSLIVGVVTGVSVVIIVEVVVSAAVVVVVWQLS